MIFNLYSFIFASIVVLIAAAAILFRKGFSRNGGVIWLGILAGLVVVWFGVRPEPGVLLTVDEVKAQIGSGEAVLLEFQSPY